MWRVEKKQHGVVFLLLRMQYLSRFAWPWVTAGAIGAAAV
jgi:hypothetical protein